MGSYKCPIASPKGQCRKTYTGLQYCLCPVFSSPGIHNCGYLGTSSLPYRGNAMPRLYRYLAPVAGDKLLENECSVSRALCRHSAGSCTPGQALWSTTIAPVSNRLRRAWLGKLLSIFIPYLEYYHSKLARTMRSLF